MQDSTDGLWQTVPDIASSHAAVSASGKPASFRAVRLDHSKLRPLLARAPRESAQPLPNSPEVIELPMPDGTLSRFRFVESPVMAPELAAEFPEIKTFLGQGIDDPAARVRFDVTPAGFHAQILSPQGAVYIDPCRQRDPNLHASHYKRDYHRALDDFRCLTSELNPVAPQMPAPPPMTLSGGDLRTYRLACAATGEYTQFHGGTVAAGMAAIVTAVNRVTGIYEAELAIRLVLVASNDLIVFADASTDPYSNGDGSAMLAQNQATLDTIIGSANYDIGHVFSTGGGGIAYLGVVCRPGLKAGGVTGRAVPIGDPFYVDYVAHEMGHQFGARHTFNSSLGACNSGNRHASTAYEPGSGSTIMAYAGICGSDNLQSHSDPYFHSASLEEIIAYTTSGAGSSCPVVDSTGNHPPSLEAVSNYTIPKGTAFTLTAAGSDADGDILTYCWEERDLGPAQALGTPDNGSSPLFRSWPPTTNSSRTFPCLLTILSNAPGYGETLPFTSRTLSFRVTARDNRQGGGGISSADMQVTVSTNAGPFVVTSPNSAVTWSNFQTVTWNPAGTANGTIRVTAVNILLSTNEGLTFPIPLATNTPNDGWQIVQLPPLATSSARIKVEAVGNVFFDISNTNFTILPYTPEPVVVLDACTLLAENCASTNGLVDPGENLLLNFTLKNLGSLGTTNLIATLLATNGVTLPSGPQAYGALSAGGGSASRAFAFTAVGDCGGAISATLQLQDGAVNLGTVTETFILGTNRSTIQTFTNSAAVAILDNTAAVPYPSTVVVSGVTGVVTKVAVTLTGFTHTWPDDTDVLLVGPQGQTVMLLSDAGGGGSVTNLTFTFDDDAVNSLPDSLNLSSGTWKPSPYESETDDFPSPAPAGPFGQTLGVFNGLDPNGSWSLFVRDDADMDSGAISQGWSLSISTSNTVCCDGAVSADLAVSHAVSFTNVNVGSNVVWSLTVTNLGPAPANEVVVTNLLPPGLRFVSGLASRGSWASSDGVVFFNLGSMSNGASAVITLEAVAEAPGSITNTVSVSSSTTDPVAPNNQADMAIAVNALPLLSAISNQTTLEDTATAPIEILVGDAETPADLLTLSVMAADTNLVSDAGFVLGGSGSNRTLTIIPASNQSGTTSVSVALSDGLATSLTSFTLTVLPVNDPPALAVLPDRTVHAGTFIRIAASATDSDSPTNNIAFALDGSAPTGASLADTNGLFTWQTGEADVNTTNLITIRATDDGSPILSDAKSFTITVLPRPEFVSLALSNGIAFLKWKAIPGQTYGIQYQDTAGETNWTDLTPDTTATGSIAETTDSPGDAPQRYYRLTLRP